MLIGNLYIHAAEADTTNSRVLNIVVLGASVRGEELPYAGTIHKVTNDEADMGDDMRDGINFYLEEHPEIGDRVKLFYGKAAIKLMNEGKVDAVLNFSRSRIRNLTDKDQVLHMEIALDRRLEESCAVAASNAITVLGYKKVAVIRGTSAKPKVEELSQGWIRPLRNILERKGVDISEIEAPMENADYKSAILKLSQYDAVVLVPFIDPSLFLAQYKELNCQTPIVSEMRFGGVKPKELAEGHWSISPAYSKEFQDAFEKRFQRQSAPWAFYSYDSIKFLSKVLVVYKWNPQMAQRYLNALKKHGDAGTYYMIDEDGCFDPQAMLIKIENGGEKRISLKELSK
jgi:hypothetical protein